LFHALTRLNRADLARPESGAAPSLMLEYQKSRRRRATLGLDAWLGVHGVESNASLTARMFARAKE
jgi:hypothetical protein